MAILGRMMARLNGLTPADDQKFLDDVASFEGDRLDGYQLYQDYYDGEQRTRLTDRAKKYLQASGLRFAENFCETVADVLAERLVVTGFSSSLAETEKGPDGLEEEVDELGSTLGEWWERSRMDGLQDVVHTTTMVKGDAFLIVDFDAELNRPRFSFNRPEIIRCFYADDSTDRFEFVAKRWNSTAVGPLNETGRAIVRLNIYWPDRVEKYFRMASDKGQWSQWMDAGDEAWPVPWADSAGEPLGIPVFHFRNKPLGREYGRSELKGVIPQQDELNKLILDLNAFCDELAYPQDYVTGVQGEKTFKRVIGDVWSADSDQAKFGRLEAGDGKALLQAIEECLSRMARRSRTPLHLLTGGDMPSGEALKSAEAGLVAKAEKAQVWLGNTWEQAMLYGVRLQQAFGTPDVTIPEQEEVVLSCQWKDTESRNEKEQLEAALMKKELGVSGRTLIAEIGYDPVREAERKDAEQAKVDEMLGAALDRDPAMPPAQARMRS